MASEQPVRFTFAVPAGTLPGFYVAALVAQTSDSLEIPGSTNLRQYIRSAVSVEITVPGKATSGLRLGSPAFSQAGTQVQRDVPITNTGTARLRPEGTLAVTSPEGKTIVTSPIKMSSFYGGYSTSVRAIVPAELPFGDHLVTLQVMVPGTGASASIQDVKTAFAAPMKPAAPPAFVVDEVTVTPQGNPPQYADVAATMTNSGQGSRRRT